ncbi:MAG TPA: formate dehydrogenase subunit gamma [Bryobacteraceae bacterium]|nr:formate dehydrogenase subunit gamma [Bryobacteraceae bacterium]
MTAAEPIERYTFRERLMHWLTALFYTYCLGTGLAFYTPHLFWIAVVLGGGPTSRYWHPIVGVLFLVCTIWMHDMWRRDMAITETDKRWLKRMENYAKNQDELLPLQERYNAGQKLYYWLMVYGAIVLLISGLFLWFPELVSFRVGWIRSIMVLIHEIAALLTIGGFIVHVYMSVFFVPGSMEAMTVGTVSRAWARTHHRLWYIRATGGDASTKE